MTPAKLRTLRRLVRAGEGPTEIATALGVSRATVYRALAAQAAAVPAPATVPPGEAAAGTRDPRVRRPPLCRVERPGHGRPRHRGLPLARQRRSPRPG